MSSHLEAMREKFGDADTEDYLAQAKAVRALLRTWIVYADSPENSITEALAKIQYERMVDDMKNHPDKTLGIVECLVAMVHSLQNGGSLENWFGALDLEW